MASVSGYIINLPEAVERRERLERHLHQLGIASHYTWFEAQRGADESNARRGLSPGEDGLWRSVLHLLERAELGSADYPHIVEDDVELSRQFWQWLCAPGKTLQITQALAFAQNAEHRHQQQLPGRDANPSTHRGIRDRLEVADQIEIGCSRNALED
jgi:hypothetical protein